jgi:hypothetical protein
MAIVVFPWWGKVLLVYGLIGLYDFAHGQFLPKSWPQLSALVGGVSWELWAIGFLLLLVVALFEGGYRTWRAAVSGEPRPMRIGKTTILQDGRPPPRTRYERLDADDRGHLPELLVVKRAEADFSRLTAVEPYMDFVLVVSNASVFEIRFCEEVQGHISFDDQELRESPQILEPKRGAVVRHGRETQIRLRQWIAQDTAAKIREKYPSGSQIRVGFDQLTLLFEPVDEPLPLPRDRPHRLPLPNQDFQVRY